MYVIAGAAGRVGGVDVFGPADSDCVVAGLVHIPVEDATGRVLAVV